MTNVYPYREEKLLWKNSPSLYQASLELTRAYGDHTLAFLGLAPENEHFLAAGEKGLVNYRLVDHVAVVMGDPLCPHEAREQVTRDFLKFCAAHRWSVAFYQVSSRWLDIYRALGLRALKIGEEAILPLRSFTLHGSDLANIRTKCRRASRAGIQIEWHEGIPAAAVMQQLAYVSRSWLDNKGNAQLEETGFSTGKLGEIQLAARLAEQIAGLPGQTRETAPRFITGAALTNTGEACAFVTFTPIYGPGIAGEDADSFSLALDLMRRSPDAPGGAMELLLVQALERFSAQGVSSVSLGLAALADTSQEISSGERRLLRFVTNHLGLLKHTGTLFAFKQKFHPHWESRYLVFHTRRALPQVALALFHLRNYAGNRLVRTLVKWLKFSKDAGKE